MSMQLTGSFGAVLGRCGVDNGPTDSHPFPLVIQRESPGVSPNNGSA